MMNASTSPIVCLDGRFIKESEASLPITDRAILYGDGVFTTTHVNDGVVELFDGHMARLARDSKALGIEAPELSQEIFRELIIKNDALTGRWRMKISISGGDTESRDLRPRRWGHYWITLSPYTPFTSTAALQTLAAMVSPFTARVKTLAYLERLHLMEQARQRGLDDLLLTLPDGTLLESSFGNVLWVDGRTLTTPSLELPLLPGLTRQTVLEAASDLGYAVKECRATLDGIPEKARLYITGVLVGLRPVHRCNDRDFIVDESADATLISAYRALLKARSWSPSEAGALLS